MGHGTPAENLDELLELALTESKRAVRHARLSTQLLARAKDAAAAQSQSEEDTEHGNRHDESRLEEA